MTLYTYRALANGSSTDHPVPDLPFVDDSHIPVDDPGGIEAVGRHPGTDTWGRYDANRRNGGWTAFTTDPLRRDLAWIIRWHPDHGRSVLLYSDEDVAAVHTVFDGPALLFRSGGYWWDGTTWFRPAQIWDGAAEDYIRRPVPSAVTVTAADLLVSGGDPEAGRTLSISEFESQSKTPAAGQWIDDLALWAREHGDRGSLTASVVKLTAPELTGDQLVGVAEMAKAAGVSASTLRAYLSRGEATVPLPQATVSGRNAWSQPVAREWAEERRRSADDVASSVSVEKSGASVPVGIADIWNRLGRSFLYQLWGRPDVRRRWALRWRTEAAIRDIAAGLAWEVAAGLDKIIPAEDLAATIQLAVLEEFRTGQQLSRDINSTKLHLAGPDDATREVFYGIAPKVTRMLDWLIRHYPVHARAVVPAIIGEAEDHLGIPRDLSQNSIRTALSLDAKLDQAAQDEFLDRVFTPAADAHAP